MVDKHDVKDQINVDPWMATVCNDLREVIV